MELYIFLYLLVFCIWLLNKLLTFKTKTNDILLSIVLLLLIVISTARYGIGFDFYSYEKVFYSIAQTPLVDILCREAFHTVEFGFVVLTKVISMICADYTFFIGAVAIIINSLIFSRIRKYSADIWFSILLYLSLQQFAFTMNLTRQAISFAIVFYSYSFLKERNWLKYLFGILLASLFHISALIVIPCYLFAHMKCTLKNAAILNCIFIFFYCTFDWYIEFIVLSFFSDYAGYIDSHIYWNGNSFIYAIFPLIIYVTTCLLFHWNKNYVHNILMNYSFFSFVFSVLITKHFIIERFSIYFSIHLILLIPELISCCNSEKRKNIASVFILLICTFYYIFAYHEGFHEIYPYFSVFDKLIL